MKFYIKQKVFSFKDKFDITDSNQNLMYQVKGKFMSLQNKLQMLDKKGEVIFTSKKKLFRLLPKYLIFDMGEQEVASIVAKLSIRPKFELSILNKDRTVEGSFFAHSFNILDNGVVVASIAKKVISWGDTYEIDIHEENNTELYLFVVIILDQILHERKH